jgi:hypothetical protein
VATAAERVRASHVDVPQITFERLHLPGISVPTVAGSMTNVPDLASGAEAAAAAVTNAEHLDEFDVLAVIDAL